MKKESNLLEGNLVKQILLFTLPLAAASMLQQLFNAADIAVVGRFAGQEALAAVGANSTIVNLVVNLFVGLSVGANAVISSYIGKDEPDKVRKAIQTSILVAIAGGLLAFAIGQIFAFWILEWMSCPANILDMAQSYLRIYFCGMPFMMVYNFCAAILRSKGDTRRPLLILCFTGTLNVALNLYFVLILHMAAAGVALATTLSNVVSSGIILFFLMREPMPFKLQPAHLGMDWKIFKRILEIGMPAGLQGVMFSFSNMVIQTAINRLGSVYVAANTAAVNFEFIFFLVANAFNQAALTFISQNYAAGKYARCRKICFWSITLMSITCVSLAGLIILIRSKAIFLFTDSVQVAEIACLKLLILMSFELFNGLIEALSGILRGLGRSLVPALAAILGICVFRIVYIQFIPSSPDAYASLIFAYPFSWLLTSSFLIFFTLRLIARLLPKEKATDLIAAASQV